MRWEPALNAFAITFGGRITPTGNNQLLSVFGSEECGGAFGR